MTFVALPPDHPIDPPDAAAFDGLVGDAVPPASEAAAPEADSVDQHMQDLFMGMSYSCKKQCIVNLMMLLP